MRGLLNPRALTTLYEKGEGMKIAVTGGEFIDSHFIKHILEKYPGYKILNIDKLTYAGNLENLNEVGDNRITL